MLNFQVVMPLNKPLVVNWSETRVLTSRKCEAIEGMSIRNSSLLLWLTPPFFASGKSIKNANFFRPFSTSKKPFGGYFG